MYIIYTFVPTQRKTTAKALTIALLATSRLHSTSVPTVHCITRLAMTLSLALHLLYLSLRLKHSHSVGHLGLVGSHDRNLSVSASGVFDILAL